MSEPPSPATQQPQLFRWEQQYNEYTLRGATLSDNPSCPLPDLWLLGDVSAVLGLRNPSAVKIPRHRHILPGQSRRSSVMVTTHDLVGYLHTSLKDESKDLLAWINSRFSEQHGLPPPVSEGSQPPALPSSSSLTSSPASTSTAVATASVSAPPPAGENQTSTSPPSTPLLFRFYVPPGGSASPTAHRLPLSSATEPPKKRMRRNYRQSLGKKGKSTTQELPFYLPKLEGESAPSPRSRRASATSSRKSLTVSSIKTDFALLCSKAKSKELELSQDSVDDPHVQALAELESRMEELSASVDQLKLVVTFFGEEEAGKTWMANVLLQRFAMMREEPSQQEEEAILPNEEELGRWPLPSISSAECTSPWPVTVRLQPMRTPESMLGRNEVVLYRELCSKEEFLLRVKHEKARFPLDLQTFSCKQNPEDRNIWLDESTEIGKEIASYLAKRQSLVLLRASVETPDEVVSVLRGEVKKRLEECRLMDRHNFWNLLTQKFILEFPCNDPAYAGFEFRDCPGYGSTGWHLERLSNFCLGTNVVCFVPNDLRGPRDDALRQLSRHQLLSELNLDTDSLPPTLILLINATKRVPTPRPDATLDGDGEPFVDITRRRMLFALEGNKYGSEINKLWNHEKEEMRDYLVDLTMRTFEVLPFYPRTINKVNGRPFTAFVRLFGVLNSQRKMMTEVKCKPGLRQGRQWLHHARQALFTYGTKVVTNATDTPIKNQWARLKEDFLKANQRQGKVRQYQLRLQNQYMKQFKQALEFTDECTRTISQRLEPLLQMELFSRYGEMVATESPAIKLTQMVGIQPWLGMELRKEVLALMKEKLEAVEQLRSVVVQSLDELLESLFPLLKEPEVCSIWKRWLHQLHESIVEQEDSGFFDLSAGMEQTILAAESSFPLFLERVLADQINTCPLRGHRSVVDELSAVMKEVLRWCLLDRSGMNHSLNVVIDSLLVGYEHQIRDLLHCFKPPFQMLPHNLFPDEGSLENKLQALEELHGVLAKHNLTTSFLKIKRENYSIDNERLNRINTPVGLLKSKQATWVRYNSNFKQDEPLGPSSHILESASSSSDRVITCRDALDGAYHFLLPPNLQARLSDHDLGGAGSSASSSSPASSSASSSTSAMEVANEQASRPAPLFAVMMSVDSVEQLRERLETEVKDKPESSVPFLFIVSWVEDLQAIMNLYGAERAPKSLSLDANTYIILMPPRVHRDDIETVAVVKAFAEALKSENCDVQHYWLMMRSACHIRQYDPHTCQMVPSTLLRAFDEGRKVYEHLSAQYQQAYQEFIRKNWPSFDMIKDEQRQRSMDLIQRACNNGEFNVEALLETLKSEEDEPVEERKKALQKYRCDLMRNHGSFRIGPICIADRQNGSSRWNQEAQGTFFPSKYPTNLVLFNTNAMKHYSIPLQQRATPTGQLQPLHDLFHLMRKDGKSPILLFNFEYWTVPSVYNPQILDEQPRKSLRPVLNPQEQPLPTSFSSSPSTLSASTGGEVLTGIPELDQMVLFLRSKGVELHDPEGAPSDRLYRCLAMQHYGFASAHDLLRQRLATCLEENEAAFGNLVRLELLQHNSNGSFSWYVQEMRNNQITPPAELLFLAFTRAYNCALDLYWADEQHRLCSKRFHNGMEDEEEEEELDEQQDTCSLAWVITKDGLHGFFSISVVHLPQEED